MWKKKKGNWYLYLPRFYEVEVGTYLLLLSTTIKAL